MENQEINLEIVHRLIDSLQSQAKEGNVQEMLSATQTLMAELQHIHLNNSQTPRHTSVSVVMPFAGRAFTKHAELERTSTLKPKEPGYQMVQPPTILTETSPSEATDSHSFGTIDAVSSPASHPPAADKVAVDSLDSTDKNVPLPDTAAAKHGEPVQKELFELQPEEEAVSFTPLKAAQYPTSIPSDSPEIQQTHQPEAKTDTDSGAEKAVNGAPASNSAKRPLPATDPLTHNQAAESTNTNHLAAELRPNPDQAPDPSFDQAMEKSPDTAVSEPETSGQPQAEDPTDKRRHLAFIHENFSSWADYGMPAEAVAPTLVQNQPLTKEVDNSYNSNYQQQHYKELNEQLNQPQEEWAHKMQSTPIDNLASAIGINDRYLFISELFRGDESMYERSIITLNKFSGYPQAHAWLERELRLKLGWDTQNPITQQFEQLIERRFMKRS